MASRCPLIAGDPKLGPPNLPPGQARALGSVRVPEKCGLDDYLPWDGSDAGPGNPRSYLGMGQNWERGNYVGGSSSCYASNPQQPMFPRQLRWQTSPLGGWWPSNPDYNGGVLVKPANFCPGTFYQYDQLAPWGLKSF